MNNSIKNTLQFLSEGVTFRTFHTDLIVTKNINHPSSNDLLQNAASNYKRWVLLHDNDQFITY